MQADEIETSVELLICPLTTTLLDVPLYRPTVTPSAANGLKATSQIMADKVGPVPFRSIDEVVGWLDEADMMRLNVALVTILELGS